MLTVTGIGNAEYLIGSVAVGIDDYYVGSGEAPGVWQGQLAADLGLVGVVDADDLRALLIGDEPGTGVGLLDGHRSRKIAAFDLTFSAPKSVSLLWAFAGPEVSAVASMVVGALIDPENGLCARRARFREAHIVEQVAALGGGRLDVAAVERLATALLGSEEAVLLVDRTGRRSPEYSTVDHLLTEDAVLYHLDQLIPRRVDGIDETLVEQAIAAEAPGLGADQAAAVRALCSGGEALCSLISPAGFGKTTTMHAAVVAAGHAGLPVVGLAATNQASMNSATLESRR